MTPEQSFSRWIKIALSAFFLFFVYFVIADNYMPMTPEARIQRYVVPVSARVSGQVSRVHVTNNQLVEPGQLLFELDDSDYRLAVQRAELALSQARVEQQRAQSGLAEVKAEVHKAELQVNEQEREAARIARLHRQGHMSQQQLEQANTSTSLARDALTVANARQQEVGQAVTAAGIAVEQAEVALRQARLELARTRVQAESRGRIGNLQLRQGQHATAGQPLLALISDQAWVSADLREKSLRHVQSGTPVEIIFDALPGQVFAGHVTSIDSGVREGQQAADGLLAQPVNSDRWVRDAQRLRTHITLDEAWPPLATGAKATVQLYPVDNPVLHGLAAMQARVVSLLRYLY
ncbi:HlyD family secretion protein [Oceanisphaera arctica]|uniref:Secretion protein HlyD n=1 Tax=Oceanisphaera arctica TaxID=641510 RepID=A0A2P5TLY9_9GAMM|nr:HlyD family secretion protein [Oceanisphaera arctica]PPL16373.1 secretion protein HlyD [Oceanisphaera arctica]GHA14125.1 secretion protein [Oceanisphaera arctica]